MSRAPAMWRYYAIATVLVVIFVGIVALVDRPGTASRERFPDRSTTATPSAGRAEAMSPGETAAFDGAAPWALSALPDCFAERSVVRGTLAYVDARRPPVAIAPAPGTSLAVASCRIDVGAGRLVVTRPPDRFVVDDVRRFYLTRTADRGRDVVLERERAPGRVELRIYRPRATPSEGSTPPSA